MPSFSDPPRRTLAAAFAATALVTAPASAQQRFERVSVSSSGVEGNAHQPSDFARVSADGRFVAFSSNATNLAPNDANGRLDVYVRDRQLGTTVLISATAAGFAGNDRSELTDLSEDGRFVVFLSWASDLVPGDSNGFRDVYVRDRDPDGNGLFDEANATTIRATLGAGGVQPNEQCTGGSISADGRFIAFDSDASNLVAGDVEGRTDVFVRDLSTGAIERVSVAAGGAGGNGYSVRAAISRDGGKVAFASAASNLVAGDLNGALDLFLRDLGSDVTTRVSLRDDGGEIAGDSDDYEMSGDANRFVWWSGLDGIVADDTNGRADVFLRDVAAGTTLRLSIAADGSDGDKSAELPRISANGAFVVFQSDSTNLAGIETNGTADAFLWEAATGKLRKLSVHVNGIEGDARSSALDVSDDGAVIPCYSDSFDLIGGDANGLFDLLVRDRTLPDPDAQWRNYGSGWPGTLGVPALTLDANPVMGTTIGIELGNSAGFPAVGFLYCGISAIAVPTRLGGTLLVDPAALMVLLVDVDGTKVACDLPLDEALAGVSAYAQLLLLDPGASKGVAFSPGLEAVLGQ